ncbi:nineteen complex-related protein 2-domain-containing protein [Kalaharituber pfeilii]|nr:nineteen complex-related protein 2-domain-containing protein [Kalaharituber pfeilii]
MPPARRLKPRKIGGDESSEEEPSRPVVVKKKPGTSTPTAANSPGSPAVRPPKPKRPPITITAAEPSSRLSFTDDPAHNDADTSFTIKKSALSRKALERSALARAGARTLPLPHLPDDSGAESSGSTGLYSKEYLEELRSATPSAPVPSKGAGDGDGDTDVVMQDSTPAEDPLGTLSKFGTTATAAAASSSTSIPDPALVKALKARRAAAAVAAADPKSGISKDYISLAPGSESDSDPASRSQKKKHSRLTHPTSFLDEDDDPELASFVNDPAPRHPATAVNPARIVLTSALSSRRNAELEEKTSRRDRIQEALAQVSDSDSDGLSAESSAFSSRAPSPDRENDLLKATWLDTQLSRISGVPGSERQMTLEDRLAYQPPNIPPLPSLDSSVKRLETLLAEMVKIRDRTVMRVEEIRMEKGEIGRRKAEVQEGLRRVGAEYERLERELGGKISEVKGERGLEDLGVGGGGEDTVMMGVGDEGT